MCIRDSSYPASLTSRLLPFPRMKNGSFSLLQKERTVLSLSLIHISSLMAEVIRWLNVKLAPCISIHGVLLDVFGEGVLIMGESGSERVRRRWSC